MNVLNSDRLIAFLFSPVMGTVSKRDTHNKSVPNFKITTSAYFMFKKSLYDFK